MDTLKEQNSSQWLRSLLAANPRAQLVLRTEREIPLPKKQYFFIYHVSQTAKTDATIDVYSISVCESIQRNNL